MKIIASLLLSTALFSVLPINATGNSKQRLFETKKTDTIPYRIPAIATCSNGDLIAVSDYRYCKADIGFGPVDLHYRISRDNGRTWGPEALLADGNGIEKGNVWDYAFGDCAIVADRNGSEVLVLCVAGKMPYSRSMRTNPTRIACFRSHDNGQTWDQGTEITEQIYGLFDHRKTGPIRSLFVGSGKIHQSRYVKTGKFYRLYAALCTYSGNFVIFSDDFGDTWKVLGDADESCCPDGDEPKCEELPNGSVVLSSRSEGRMFNIYTFTDIKSGAGQWGRRAKATAFEGIKNACNGEILVLKARNTATRRPTFVAVQSVPFGPQRANVGFFYRELDIAHLTPEAFADDWHKGLQVSNEVSAYSTMTPQHDGRIGFLWEEGPTNYNIDYISLSLSDITRGRFTIDRSVKKEQKHSRK